MNVFAINYQLAHPTATTLLGLLLLGVSRACGGTCWNWRRFVHTCDKPLWNLKVMFARPGSHFPMVHFQVLVFQGWGFDPASLAKPDLRGFWKGHPENSHIAPSPNKSRCFLRGGGFDMVIWRCYHCLDEIGRSWKMIWSLTRLLAVWFVVSVGRSVLCILVAPSGVHIWRLGC